MLALFSPAVLLLYLIQFGAQAASVSNLEPACEGSSSITRVTKYVALDVEAVATGPGHNDRAPCRVSAVNEDGAVLLDRIINVDSMYDPVTEISGLTEEDIRGSPWSFDDVRNELLSLLSPTNTVIIGYFVSADIEWMRLKEGEHFASSIDIEKMFRLRNKKNTDWIHFSLADVLFGLFNERIHEGSHSSVVDAQKAMQLYLEYREKSSILPDLRNSLFMMRRRNEFPTRKKYTTTKVCLHKFNPKKCSCGQPITFK